ncbi:MAG: hypothetical protein WBD22_06735 [Pyrinomonadaceae bacterium]
MMVNRIDARISDEKDRLNENDTAAVLTYISDLKSTRRPTSKDNTLNDDLIMYLSDAYENKRDRQVAEWERLRRVNVQRAM